MVHDQTAGMNFGAVCHRIVRVECSELTKDLNENTIELTRRQIPGYSALR